MDGDLLRVLEDKPADWSREAPATEDTIQGLIRDTGIDFPEEYLNLLRYSNGGEGELGVDPLWFSIYPVEEVVELNRRYDIESYLPGYFAFGSNMGGEALLFDTKESKPWKVYYAPIIGMEEDQVLECAANFKEFVRSMGRPSPKTEHETEVTPTNAEQWLKRQGPLP
jgi:hypothetical protein